MLLFIKKDLSPDLTILVLNTRHQKKQRVRPLAPCFPVNPMGL